MPEFLRLKKSNCKNCYKCIRHCPVKSIRFSGNQAHIVPDECILCGQCFVVCPQNAKEIADGTEQAKVLLDSGAPVIASVAPSFIANFDGAGIENISKALQQLGFLAAEETAVGAAIVKTEYERLLKEDNRSLLISSCCHTVNLLIQKHFPEALPFLADVMSPMQAHSMDIKRRYPDAKVVFIGPCLSKKDEAAAYEGITDAVLTFEELSCWLAAEGIEIEKGAIPGNTGKTRLFPTAGGILRTMKQDTRHTYMAVDGVENCIAVLREIINGNIRDCFIEMSACTGSCSCGPVMSKYHRAPLRSFTEINRYAGDRDFDFSMPQPAEIRKEFPPIDTGSAEPSEAEIAEALRKMGKTRPEDELNCGSCGYDTCREKAKAIIRGKADISMCLPFLKEKAESFSDTIISNTPTGVLVLNEQLEVQQINRAALSLMNIRRESDVMGEQVIRILDPKIFMEVRDSGRNVYDRRVFLAEYGRYVDQIILFDRGYRVIICLMRDVTAEEHEKERKEEVSRKTVEVADKVVEKQMRIVQEIASLLGETAAETKIALTNLKESIGNE